MVAIIAVTDLSNAVQTGVEPAQLALMVAGANASATRVAPCLASTDPPPTPEQIAEAKLILVGALTRWAEAGSGAWQQQSAGPFSVTTDTRQRSSGYKLWPSEITDLAALCSNGQSSGAFSIDTAPGVLGAHSETCSINRYIASDGTHVLGATYCSCGADIAGFPIFDPVP